MKSSSAAVTLSQLADLVATDRSALCRNPRLPQATPVHSATPGRPEHAISLEDLAAWALAQTAHLSEAELRVRLALAGRTEPPRTRRATKRPHRLVDNDQGGYTAVPQRVPDDYSLEDQAALRGLVHGEQRP
ncbi:hypothetical protein [Pseudomonas sp. ABFPK]|uniref:hypothetical protein n=1 Tax=Pseudomonas sp. ABFPK TaxID=1636605 RepID=UPI000778DBF4|nr:hypothetical protein [Pseudomonas sp. ABFPK]KYC14209.1 hypothetical protein WM94_27080 [Pseudomonas sp. ABFPK]